MCVIYYCILCWSNRPKLIFTCALYEGKCKWSCDPSCPVDFPLYIFIHYVYRRMFRQFGRYSTLQEYGTYEELSTPSYGYNQRAEHDLWPTVVKSQSPQATYTRCSRLSERLYNGSDNCLRRAYEQFTRWTNLLYHRSYRVDAVSQWPFHLVPNADYACLFRNNISVCVR